MAICTTSKVAQRLKFCQKGKGWKTAANVKGIKRLTKI